MVEAGIHFTKALRPIHIHLDFLHLACRLNKEKEQIFPSTLYGTDGQIPCRA